MPITTRLLAIAILIVGAALPFAWYGMVVGGAASISPAEARLRLDQQQATLVCVQEPRENAQVVADAVRWPLPQILLTRSPADVPQGLQGKPLMLICPGGVRSAQAARHLVSIGVPEVVSVRGGLQEFISAVPGLPAGKTLRQRPDLLASVPAFRESPMYEQLAIIATFFGVKFVYTVAAAGIVLVLRKRHEADLAALRWSMIAFFIGEGFCFVNVMVYHDQSLLMEHLHSVGMVVSVALGTYALIEAVDHRILHYSEAGRCGFSGLCQGCIKNAPVSCGLLQSFRWMLPMLAVLAALPLFSSFRETAYNTRIFGALHTYRHPLLCQLYELRYLPVVGIVLLLACLVVALRVDRPGNPRLLAAKVLLSAGIGAVVFSWFRLILVASFIDNQVWFASWEEVLELISIAMVGSTLFVFRRRLLMEARVA